MINLKNLILNIKLSILEYFSNINSKRFKVSIFFRRAFLLFLDECLLIASFVFTFYFLFEGFNFFDKKILFIFLIVISGIIFVFSGQYKALTRYTGSKDLYSLVFRSTATIIINYYLSTFLINDSYHLKIWFFSWLNFTFFLVFSRIILKDIILSIKSSEDQKVDRVVIVGAGATAVQLASNLKTDRKFHIASFIETSPYLWGKFIQGVEVSSIKYVFDKKENIDKILLAIPEYSLKEKNSIIKNLKPLGIPILEIPSVDDLIAGRAKLNSLRPLMIEDLLCRETMPAIPEYLVKGIKNNVICITGAGGSIGSELCKQIANLNPRKLILLENSEPSLYKIDQYLRENFRDSFKIIPILVDISSFKLVNNIFSKHSIDVVFHAAAYKHVPLVEINPITGIKNNVISTLVISQVCKKFNCKNMILISSDKAVRPTSIMGASKRLSELVVQAFAAELPKSKGDFVPKTCFSIVRFGNVLGSSGSVVPLFKEQISKGGPITLTDKRITRYFMTIKEASLLVIQSMAFAKGGEVFLLDMGEPVLIKELAIQMIKLSGLKLKDKNNPNGDIEITEVGLRPGEKLYEELLIEGDSKRTEHPLIYIANEKFIQPETLKKEIDKLKVYLDSDDKKMVLKQMSVLVKEWQPFEFKV